MKNSFVPARPDTCKASMEEPPLTKRHDCPSCRCGRSPRVLICCRAPGHLGMHRSEDGWAFTTSELGE